MSLFEGILKGRKDAGTALFSPDSPYHSGACVNEKQVGPAKAKQLLSEKGTSVKNGESASAARTAGTGTGERSDVHQSASRKKLRLSSGQAAAVEHGPAEALAEAQDDGLPRQKRKAAPVSGRQELKGPTKKRSKRAAASTALLEMPDREKPPAGSSYDTEEPVSLALDTLEASTPLRGRLTQEEEASRLLRTVFVGNLPRDVRKRRLKAIFAQCGKVESVRLRSVPIELGKKLPRRAAILSKSLAKDRGSAHAYVVFEEEESVAPALQRNMQEVDGFHIRVDRAVSARRGGAVQFDRSHSVFIGNLAFDIEDEDVIKLFDADADPDSGVRGVRIVRDAATNLGKGFGFVLFSSRGAARMALARDGAELRGRPVRVTRVAAVAGAVPAAARKRGGAGSAAPLGGKQGYEGRKLRERLAGKKADAAPWQGIRTKGAGKVVRATSAVAPKSRRPAQAAAPTPQQQSKDSKQRLSKRPAVAARKAKALGLPPPKQATEKQKARKEKSRQYRAR